MRRVRDPVTVFMGVPTMFAFLNNAYAAMPPEDQRGAAAAAARLRLAVCGSAACPLPVMRRWEEMSGQRLLERYGMTETGMILGNPVRGERRAGTVGVAFPGVDVRLAAPDAEVEAPPQQNKAAGQGQVRGEGAGAGAGAGGELLVRSAQLFAGYWGRAEATAEAFDPEGFFRTGDTARVDADGYFRLLGRTSVDVIKRGGYKISALAVESALLEHPRVGECAVVGLPDAEYGEALAAVIAPHARAAAPSLDELREWAAARLPPYSLPSVVREVAALPRNAMGKVNKKALRAELFPHAVADPAAPAA
jgi:malonyl-CoA/methylmalonyl-CoA synthetase